ncbi:hypothetical protein ACLMJK_005012 [Lecanora helva]
MPHSILKKSKPPASTDLGPPAAQSRDERNKQTALHHARLLQHRKDTEALIFESTEALLDLPSSTSADPAHPSSSDTALVKSSLEPFQPADYDALVEERNINNQCGYVLCPRPNRKQDTKAYYRILQGQGKDSDGLKFVPRQMLEKWCSDQCGRRALYIKVQLNEEPSWTRVDSSPGSVLLLEYEQSDSKNAADLAAEVSNLDLDSREDQVIERMKALSIERGASASIANQASRVIDAFEVQENADANKKDLSSEFGRTDSEHLDHHRSIEGFTPNASYDLAKGRSSDKDEDDIIGTL